MIVSAAFPQSVIQYQEANVVIFLFQAHFLSSVTFR